MYNWILVWIVDEDFLYLMKIWDRGLELGVYDLLIL